MALTNEDLLAISQLLDVKLKAELEPIKSDIQDIKEEQTRINMIIENEIRNDIKILAENYLPSAKRYEKATSEFDSIKQDVDLLKKVVQEHSEKLKRIS